MHLVASVASQASVIPQGGLAALAMELLRGARRCSGLRQESSRQPFFSVYRWQLRFPLMYELWRILRSLPGRILETQSRGLVEKGLDMNGLCLGLGVSGFPAWCSSDAFHSRIRDIQSPRIGRPWMCALDNQIFLEGYLAGIKASSGISRTADELS